MRKVVLRMNEKEKYEVIKNLVEKEGNKRRAMSLSYDNVQPKVKISIINF